MKKYILFTASLMLIFNACKKQDGPQVDVEINDDGATAERAQIADMKDRYAKLETGELKWQLDTNTLAPVAKYVVLFKSSFQPPLAEVYTGNEDGREAAAGLYDRDAKAAIRGHFRPGLINDSKIDTWFTTLSSGFYGELTAAEVKEIIRDTAVKCIDIPPVYQLEGNEVKYSSGSKPLFIHGYKTAVSTTKRIWIIDAGGDLNDPLLNVDKTLSKNFTSKAMTFGTAHGCKVSHIAASKMYNTDNVRGTAENAKVVMLKISYDGTSSWAALNSALEYCWTYSKNGDIVNISLSTSNTGTGVKAEVEKNILDFYGYDMPVVIAGGNQGTFASERSPACLGLKYKDDPIKYRFIYVVANVQTTGTEAEVKNRTTQFSLENTSNYGRAIRYGVVGTWTTIDDLGVIDVRTGTSYSAPALSGMLFHRSPSVSTFNGVLNVIKYKKSGGNYTHLVPTLF